MNHDLSILMFMNYLLIISNKYSFLICTCSYFFILAFINNNYRLLVPTHFVDKNADMV